MLGATAMARKTQRLPATSCFGNQKDNQLEEDNYCVRFRQWRSINRPTSCQHALRATPLSGIFFKAQNYKEKHFQIREYSNVASHGPFFRKALED